MTPYQAVTGTGPLTPEQSGEEDAAKFNARLQWLASQRTQEVFQELIKQSDVMVTDAIALAMNNHQQDNTKHIVTKLVQANTLRKVVSTYAATK